jgi:LmbE family N-acetylglucosaminyl deacetylase
MVWKNLMLIAAHEDDDMPAHGTLAMLQAHGNQIYIVTITTGNVGTQDPNLSRTQLAQIRRQEELAALAELGIPGEHTSISAMMTASSNLRIAKRS